MPGVSVIAGGDDQPIFGRAANSGESGRMLAPSLLLGLLAATQLAFQLAACLKQASPPASSGWREPRSILEQQQHHGHHQQGEDNLAGGDEEPEQAAEPPLIMATMNPINHNEGLEMVNSGPPYRLSAAAADKEYLSHEVGERACRQDRGCPRRDSLNNTYLSHCSRYRMETLFSSDELMTMMHQDADTCNAILDRFIQADERIQSYHDAFRSLLRRYNCHNGYSVKWNCEDCKKAYKDWLCATSLPYYMNGERVKPCISFCERVEQRCPYLHPIAKEQYGGQPVFICRDPNIPFVPEITPDIPYSEPTQCYDLCHLSDNLTELVTDSLSKYQPDKCPEKGSIAEQIRNDPRYCKLDAEQMRAIHFNDSASAPILDAQEPASQNNLAEAAAA